LRGGKRGLVGPVGVGTIDQILLSVLPVRHNALRVAALASKTVVIDEVHAFGPYMRALLVVLMRWLGELGVPVVVLSATLPTAVATELAAAYKGGDPSRPVTPVMVPYPGWRLIRRDSATEPRAVDYPADRRHTLDIDLRAVHVDSEHQVDRIPVMRAEFAALAEHGGCAAVICTTVRQAQQTYQALTEWRAGLRPEHQPRLVLLHSRFPAYRREAITEDVMTALAAAGPRPPRLILVATQVVEQSLDIDVDLMITDLAPVELLLQRAGRLQRHPQRDHDRPRWAQGDNRRRRLVVLTAPDHDLDRLPAGWTTVYPKSTLVLADRLLREYGERGIRIPEDVPVLVDRANTGDLPAYTEPLFAGFEQAEVRRGAQALVERGTAHNRAIPAPRKLMKLRELSEALQEEGPATTRFNAESERLLVCYQLPDGDLRLGGPDGEPLPTPTQDGRLSREQMIRIMRHSIPVPGYLVARHDANDRLPLPWADIWPLSQLIVARQPVMASGQIQPARIGDTHFMLDDDLGLTTIDADGDPVARSGVAQRGET
jgi:CRISPR-associated endonuclease/helicase Cas3